MLVSNIQSVEDFFEYIASYMAGGDKLTCEEDDDNVRIFKLYGAGGYILMQYNEKTNEITYPDD